MKNINNNKQPFLVRAKNFFRKIRSFFDKKSYTDHDITFYLQVYKDYELACRCLARLRKFYPASRIIVISDGDADERYKSLVSSYNVEYYEKERLYLIKYGGAMLHRIFEKYLQNPTSYLMKIDTDTRFDRRFKFLPRGLAVYGMYTSPQRVLQGGAIIFPLRIVQRIYNSKVFLSDELKARPLETWGKYLPEHLFQQRVNELGLVGFEWVLNYGCERLGIDAREFTEIYSKWKKSYGNCNLKYAVVHPWNDKN